MPSAQRQYRPSVIQRIFETPEKFELFQAVRLLSSHWHRHKADGRRQPVGEVIRFRSSVELSFPCGEIESLTKTELPAEQAVGLPAGTSFSQVEFTTAVMSLTGTTGVMPRCYTELLIAREYSFRDKAPRAFLDVFANRLIGFFYQSWFKYRVALHAENGKNNTYLAKASGLAGDIQALASPSKKTTISVGLPAEFLAAYAGAFRSTTVNASSLRMLISDHFSVPVTIESFVGQWFSIPKNEQSAMGLRGATLGSDSFCGERVWQRDQKIRIHIGPLDLQRYQQFTPNGSAMLVLQKILRHWIGEAMEVEVALILDKSCIGPAQASGTNAQLGMNVFLVTRPATDHARQLRYELSTGAYASDI